jgi:hypothetical protein
VFSNLGRRVAVYRRAIFMLYVEHHNVFSSCGSRPSARFVFDLQYVGRVLVIVFVVLPLPSGPILDERVIRLQVGLNSFCC